MNTLKFIHAADLHLDSEFESLSPEDAKRRRQGQRELLFRLADKCVSLGAQALLLSGDVFEKDTLSPDTMRDFCRTTGSLGIPVFISPGNHDPFFSGSVWERMSLPENIHIFKSENFRCIELPELKTRFWGAGFEKSFCPPLLRDFAAPERREGFFDIMLLHGDLGASDYCPVTRSEIEKSGMDYLALGHIHARGPLEHAGKTAFCYPGCPEGRGFDETGEKGAYLVTLSEDGASSQFFPLGGVRYEILNIDVTGKDPLSAITQASGGFTDRDCLRVLLTGETEAPTELPALRRALEGRFVVLQIRDETTIARDVWEQAGKDSLAGLFLQKLKLMLDAEADPRGREKIALAASYGLAALEGRGASQ